MYTLTDLHTINEELEPLKALADRELRSVYGLKGKMYTPHIDTYNTLCLKRAKISSHLKSIGALPVTEVETISAALKALHSRAKSRDIVEYEGIHYECCFSPLKMSKTGKIVRKWAKFWLKKTANGEIDAEWEKQVREIWPENFTIRNLEI